MHLHRAYTGPTGHVAVARTNRRPENAATWDRCPAARGGHFPIYDSTGPRAICADNQQRTSGSVPDVSEGSTTKTNGARWGARRRAGESPCPVSRVARSADNCFRRMTRTTLQRMMTVRKRLSCYEIANVPCYTPSATTMRLAICFRAKCNCAQNR